MHRVREDLLDLGHVVDRVLLMSRLKIKDPAQPALESTAAAKDLAARKPACKYHIIRLRDIKVFPIHLFYRNVKMRRYPLCNRVIRRCHKQSLAVSMPPAQRHACPQQQRHDLCQMCGMQCDQPHPLQHMALHTLCHLIGKLVVRPVPPIDQHIRIRQNLLSQTMFWFLQRSCPHEYIFIFLKKVSYTAVNSLWIDPAHFLLLPMQVFTPYGHFDHIFPSCRPECLITPLLSSFRAFRTHPLLPPSTLHYLYNLFQRYQYKHTDPAYIYSDQHPALNIDKWWYRKYTSKQDCIHVIHCSIFFLFVYLV